jgi:glucose-1-phosphate adenylyltransferase
MPGVHIGKNCIVRNAIIDEHCDIPDNTQIGVNLANDRERFDVTPRGVVLVTPETLLAATLTRG